MEQRLASSWRMTINEKKFIEHALLSELRVDGRRPFDYRRLTIKFGREDGSSEVQLGQTHVMGFVTSQLVQPYRDRPNEGTLSIFIEFSPMADPSFEPGRPGEFAIELGRIIDRGLRESRAVDTESLCVLAGKFVWAIRVDLHILDNGGNLVDAANVAALSALSTFQRPECTIGGEDSQEVVVHSPEVREPLPLIIHHLPIAVTFGFFDNGNIVVIDPTHNEESVMRGKMTVTMNSNGDVCAVQKAGGEGVMQSVVMQCLRIATVKAADITSKIKNAVETYNTERALRKVKRRSTLVALDVDGSDIKMREAQDQSDHKKDVDGFSKHAELRLDHRESKGIEAETALSCQGNTKTIGENSKVFIGGPSSWDPYSKGIPLDSFRSSSISAVSTCGPAGPLEMDKEQKLGNDPQTTGECMLDEPAINSNGVNLAPVESSSMGPEVHTKKTLKDAVKQKNRKKKSTSSTTDRK